MVGYSSSSDPGPLEHTNVKRGAKDFMVRATFVLTQKERSGTPTGTLDKKYR
jgi:hypothetical protein